MEDLFRASAAWAMGETGQQDLLPTLEPLSQDPDEMVRRNAVQAIAKIQDHDRMGGGKMVDEPEEGISLPALQRLLSNTGKRPVSSLCG